MNLIFEIVKAILLINFDGSVQIHIMNNSHIKKNENNKNLKDIIWNLCNEIRDNYSLSIQGAQPYILGFMFYKFLSEKITNTVENLLKGRSTFKDLKENEELYNRVKTQCIDDKLGYFIDYKDTFRSVLDDSNFNSENLIDRLSRAFKNIEDSTIGSDSSKDFKGLFSDIQLDASALGNIHEEKVDTLLSIMKHLDIEDLNVKDISNDNLGDAYEFLIGKFAFESGQKAGEFYTPAPVSELLAKIATHKLEKVTYIYDPTCGSGSLLVKASKYLKGYRKILGQEKSNETYNMARMNMFLHGIKYSDFLIENGNTLKDNKFWELEKQIDLIVANPPFSIGWSPNESLDDKRFKDYPKMAPPKTADYAFIQHMLYMLKENGRCAVVVPHGVLFRGNAEGIIREYIVGNMKYLRAVIGLPKNMFFNASIPACIILFEKKSSNEKILFIEGSKEFIKDKNKNRMTKENIDKIFDVFSNKKEIQKFSRLVSLDEIKENDFNLNITRYIDTFEEEEEIDIDFVNDELKKVNQEIEKVEKEIEDMIKELVEVI